MTLVGMDDIEPFQYQPLSDATSSIRILTLLPNLFDNDVEIQLREIEVSDADRHPFTALSYVWGSRESPTKINITRSTPDSRTGFLEITSNLHEALRYLRDANNARDLWIDAISVNQADLIERAAQVRLMAQIYINANQTVVWLGPTADESSLAIRKFQEWSDVLQRTATDEQMNVTISGREFQVSSLQTTISGPDYEATASFILRDWFERLWIRQEIFHSQHKAVLLCGRDSITWADFKRAFDNILRNPNHSFPGESAIDFHTFCFRLRAISQMIDVNYPVTFILRIACDALCEDPRDRVFGVLGYLPPESAWLSSAMSIDYTSSVNAVYTNCAVSIIQHLRNLEILDYSEYDPDWRPTWAPNWASLVRDGPHPMYATAMATVDICELAESRLTVKGLTVSSIARVPVITIGVQTVSQNWTRVAQDLAVLVSALLATNMFESRMDIVKRFAAILVSHVADVEVKAAGFYAWPQQWSQEEFVRTLVEMLDGDLTADLGPELFDWTIHLVRMAFNAIKRMSLAVSIDGELLVGPPSMSPGDIIAVLLGSDNPLILRKNGSSYEVVGICSMPSVDLGQALLGEFLGDWQFLKDFEGGTGFNRAFTQWLIIEGRFRLTYLDPRIQWEELVVDKDDPRRAGGLIGPDSAADYRLPDAEYFERHGVEFEKFELI